MASFAPPWPLITVVVSVVEVDPVSVEIRFSSISTAVVVVSVTGVTVNTSILVV